MFWVRLLIVRLVVFGFRVVRSVWPLVSVFCGLQELFLFWFNFADLLFDKEEDEVSLVFFFN